MSSVKFDLTSIDPTHRGYPNSTKNIFFGAAHPNLTLSDACGNGFGGSYRALYTFTCVIDSRDNGASPFRP